MATSFVSMHTPESLRMPLVGLLPNQICLFGFALEGERILMWLPPIALPSVSATLSPPSVKKLHLHRLRRRPLHRCCLWISDRMEIANEKEYHVRDIPTRSVTLFPTRAQVVRDIKDVALKVSAGIPLIPCACLVLTESQAGSNVITIVGLSPTVDEHSIKVEGTGSAIIADIACELVPNKDTYKDVYPGREDSTEESLVSSKDDTSTSSEEGKRRQRLAILADDLVVRRDDLERADETMASANRRLELLNLHFDSMFKAEVQVQGEQHWNDVASGLETYGEQRAKAFSDQMEAKAGKRQIQQQIAVLQDEEKRLWQEQAKAFSAKGRAGHKERDPFWRQTCYTVRITLEASSTPNTSCPSSTSGDVDGLADETISTCDLGLTYMMSGASWVPNYDLALSTTTNTANLCFDAMLTNTTSETWSNCKVMLTTSHTNFHSLESSIPVLSPWRVKLGGPADKDVAALSQEEHPPKKKLAHSKPSHNNALYLARRSLPYRNQEISAMASVAMPSVAMPSLLLDRSEAIDVREQYDQAEEMVADSLNEVTFEDSVIEETGLTTTYELPGNKTLKPSTTPSKQRVASITFANVTFSHTVVPKLDARAYLKARLLNNSKLTLLNGQAGLTLDNTFIGRSKLPRCSAGDTFSISLGVDPAIRVVYPKPDVKRGSTGMFNKEDVAVYKRSVTLVNTRAASSKPARITVLDQLPVSEDEKLRVHVLHPRNMDSGGPPVAVGYPVRGDAKDWGKASAAMKATGEVAWHVVLNAGQNVKLNLEYEMMLPVGGQVLDCSVSSVRGHQS